MKKQLALEYEHIRLLLLVTAVVIFFLLVDIALDTITSKPVLTGSDSLHAVSEPTEHKYININPYNCN
jgi:hypothetical protein